MACEITETICCTSSVNMAKSQKIPKTQLSILSVLLCITEACYYRHKHMKHTGSSQEIMGNNHFQWLLWTSISLQDLCVVMVIVWYYIKSNNHKKCEYGFLWKLKVSIIVCIEVHTHRHTHINRQIQYFAQHKIYSQRRMCKNWAFKLKHPSQQNYVKEVNNVYLVNCGQLYTF